MFPTTYELFDEAGLTRIEAQAAQILDEIGVELQDDPRSLEALASIGGRVDGQRLRIDAGALRERIASAPQRFVWRGQSAEASVEIGGPRPVVAPTFGPPNVVREDGRKARGTMKDYRELVRLCDASDVIDSTGFLLCIAHDGDAMAPYRQMAQIHLELSDKPMMGTIISVDALHEVADMAGVSGAEPGACRMLHMINLTPPLTYQPNPLRCLRASAELGQGTTVSSYMMLGATAPVTLVGALAQGLAEVMVGLALTQIYRPGAPVVGCIFATPFSMQFMGPTFGTPETHMSQLAGCQLIRRLGIPCRADGMISSSKLNDAQAGFEGAASLTAALNAGADLILHAAGWSEFGRAYSIEKFRSDEAILRHHLAARQQRQSA